MDRYEYIICSISMYINGYTARMMPMNIDSVSLIAYTRWKLLCSLSNRLFLKIVLTGRGEIELQYSFLSRNSRIIQSSSNVVLM